MLHVANHSFLIILRTAFLPALLTVLFIITLPDAKALGYTQILQDDFEIGVWYPSDASQTAGSLGPFEVQYAFNALPKRGLYPVILFSHNNKGVYRNHYLTLQSLASAGFIVIAPQHRVDHFIGGSNTGDAIKTRVAELKLALKLTSEDELFKDVINTSDINGLGYEWGGVTILAASGGSVDLRALNKYCNTNKKNDSEFCNQSPGVLNRLKRLTKSVDLLAAKDNESYDAFINHDVALIASVGQGIILANKSIFPNNFYVLDFDNDEMVPFDFHARHLYEQLTQHGIVCLEQKSAHHFAFIAKTPNWVTDKEVIEFNKDPRGFNRERFLMQLNRNLNLFFTGRKRRCDRP